VAFRLIPREERFFDDFVALAEQIRRGARLLEEMLAPEHPIWDKADEIKEVEHKCDFITHEVIQRLHRTFITPLDREDIHLLASDLDDVMDVMDGTARRAEIFRLGPTPPGVMQLLDVIERMMAVLAVGVAKLRKGDDVLKYCIEAKKLEEEGDAVYHDMLGRLFDTESNGSR
jgi:uncharacterized protein Yka (UPF0111/DUF47 family)